MKVQCPKCLFNESFSLSVRTKAVMNGDGVIEEYGNEYEYGPLSMIECPYCGNRGHFETFVNKEKKED